MTPSLPNGKSWTTSCCGVCSCILSDGFPTYTQIFVVVAIPDSLFLGPTNSFPTTGRCSVTMFGRRWRSKGQTSAEPLEPTSRLLMGGWCFLQLQHPAVKRYWPPHAEMLGAVKIAGAYMWRLSRICTKWHPCPRVSCATYSQMPFSCTSSRGPYRISCPKFASPLRVRYVHTPTHWSPRIWGNPKSRSHIAFSQVTPVAIERALWIVPVTTQKGAVVPRATQTATDAVSVKVRVSFTLLRKPAIKLSYLLANGEFADARAGHAVSDDLASQTSLDQPTPDIQERGFKTGQTEAVAPWTSPDNSAIFANAQCAKLTQHGVELMADRDRDPCNPTSANHGPSPSTLSQS
ncbi:hypothetical protein QBC46DRAFT_419522 [Diplogelasinospora grovesii]|uniref:Uncharacterized protein n=1 Tax=Diplogelasinospora grovesii TaxID=303347 RepID=A0AAN6N0H7_9PEZI|nr:hypothetical protein QBC46DRAFT_419522 [Diplogelasinospora grovesii]